MWIPSPGKAQDRPAPGTYPDTPLVFAGITLHVGNGTVYQPGLLVIQKDTIVFSGPEAEGWNFLHSHNLQETFRILRLDTSYHIYPGFIALNTEVGLREIDLVRATHDYAERGEFTPSLRAWIAYNVDSRIIPTLRLTGILIVESRPRGGMIAGYSAPMRLDAWTWEEALIRPYSGLHLYFPSPLTARGWWGEPLPPASRDNYTLRIERLRKFLMDSRTYLDLPETIRKEYPDINREAMQHIWEGTATVFVHAEYPAQILDALRLLYDELKIPRLVLVSGPALLEVAEEIRKRNIPVVYVNPHRLPPTDDSALDLPFRIPYLLDSLGIHVAIALPGSWEVRNLPFVMGTCIGAGLDEEKALQMITEKPAQMLGIAHRYGTLESGKSATFLVTKGKFYDPSRFQILQAYLDGRRIHLVSHQKLLYHRYLQRYGIKNASE